MLSIKAKILFFTVHFPTTSSYLFHKRISNKFPVHILKLICKIVWILLKRAPTSIHLHPPPPTSTQLISTSTQLYPLPPSSFKPPPSSLYYLQQYLNQNIARNWAISPNLGQKIKSCSF